MGVKQLVVAAFILVLIQLWCCNGCLEDERLALLQVQVSFNISWFPFEKTTNCCDWRRIECDAHTGRVTNLDLSYARGWSWGWGWDLGNMYLNASLFLSFKQLTYLDLSGNGITGCLQNEGFERLTGLNKLKYLDLSNNIFNNNILPSLSGFSFLKLLNIGDNMLNGSKNLEELVSLKNLEALRLRNNHITGFRRLTKLNKLKYLDLSYNDFNNDIFSSLSGLSLLKSLDISSNKLEGSIHVEGLCNLSSLQYLALTSNNLTGELPLCLSNFTSLQYLDISYNSLEGNIHSPSLGKLTHLEFLYLRRNNFSGTLPWWLSNLTSLQYLDLCDNSLVGNLSSSPLTLMNSIQYLNLGGNKFQIPISLVPFYNYSNLYFLNIWANELYVEKEWHSLIPKFQLETLYMIGDGCGGSFPKFLYSQHKLQRVDLRDNKIRGEFPHWLLKNNTRLKYLSLSNNSLKGTIRLPTHSHMNLSILDISSNCFSGQIPTKFGSYFPNLMSLDMSNNKLDGSFPPSIGNLFSLEFLYMSDNKLNGSFPPLIGNLSSMVVLDFSNNYLSGEVPSWLGSMEFLRILDVSGNNMFGNIPTFSKAL